MSKVGDSRRGKRFGGRKKGTPNKVTGLLRSAILKAAELSGYDKNGKEGLVGYCKRLADDEPRAFTGLLGKVLPMNVAADDDGEGSQVRIFVTGVPRHGDPE